MRAATQGFDDDDLLSQLGWIRRLASELVREPATAEDVAQDVARVALEKRASFQGDERGLRAWLAAVARRIAFDRVKAERNRASRERSAARDESDDSARSIEERSARARVVADAVDSLPEPYRATVLHRYFDELAIAEVAARTGVDEITARKRLSRAREMLRARLERGGERGDRAWLAAIAGTGLERADALPATTTGATATVAAGVGVMSTKLVAGVVTACALLAIWFLTRSDPRIPEPDRHGPYHGEPTELVEVAPANMGMTETATAEDPSRANASVASAIAVHEGTVLRVRVIDSNRRAVTKGRIDVWRDPRPYQRLSTTSTHAEIEIAGEVTEVELPRGTLSGTLSASAPGVVASMTLTIQDPSEWLGHDVILVVGELASPSLVGRVLVDGIQRIPARLSIYMTGKPAMASMGRVNTLDATWAIGSVPLPSARLSITSDETVVASVDLDAEQIAKGQLDLQLVSGRALILTLLDPAGRPQADANFRIHMLRWMPEGLEPKHADRVLRTDEHGVCHVGGIPITGSFQILPDLEPREVAYPGTDGGRFTFVAEPWHSQPVTASDPEVLEIELRVVLPSPGGSAFGFLAPELLAAVQENRAQVVSAEVTNSSPGGGSVGRVPSDASGRWTLVSHWPSRHLVWVQQSKSAAPLTEKTEVALNGPDEVGPVEFRPLEGKEVELTIRGVPAGARLSVGIQERDRARRSESPTLRNGAGVHRFTLATPADLAVSWTLFRNGDPQFEERTRRLTVDPEVDQAVMVDFGAGAAHRIVFAPTGAALPPKTKLVFSRWTTQSPWSNEVVLVTPGASGSIDGVRLGSGRWNWTCFAWDTNVAAIGVLDVSEGADDIRVAPRIVKVPRGDVAKGIVWEEADGVDLTPLATQARTYRFDAEGDVLLREDARWTQPR